jgi:hypothetical protein
VPANGKTEPDDLVTIQPTRFTPKVISKELCPEIHPPIYQCDVQLGEMFPDDLQVFGA